MWECLHIAAVLERAGEFDLIHNHLDFLPLSYSGLIRTPVVTTIRYQDGKQGHQDMPHSIGREQETVPCALCESYSAVPDVIVSA